MAPSRRKSWTLLAIIAVILLLQPLVSPRTYAAQGKQNTGRILYLANSLPSGLGSGVLSALRPTSASGQIEQLNNTRIAFLHSPIQGDGAFMAGPASVVFWLSADRNASGTLETVVGIDTQPVATLTKTLQVNSTTAKEFSLNFTLSSRLQLPFASTISLSFKMSSISPPSSTVFLYWGSTTNPTRLILPITNYASIDSVRITDASGTENRTFNLHAPLGSNLVNVLAKVRNIFGSEPTNLNGDIGAVNLTITGPNGPVKGASNVNMSRILPPGPDNLATYRFPWYYSDVPEASYTVAIDIIDSQGNIISDARGPYGIGLGTIRPPFPILEAALSLGGLGIAGLVTGVFYVRRSRSKEYLAPFSYFEQLTGGEVPGGSMVTVEANTGAGKTTLCSEIMYEDLKRGRPCIYVAADDFPDRIRDQMRSLGIDVSEYENSGLLSFVDCYSAEAGRKPTEKFSVASMGDLTTLGVKISSALRDQKGTSLYMDSLSPLVPRTKPESIVSFVHAIGAKVRGLDGKAFFTMSTGTDMMIQRQLEDMADCVIQMEAFEEKDIRRRRLRVRKFRNRQHQEGWATFTIEDGKGIIFYTKQSRGRGKSRL